MIVGIDLGTSTSEIAILRHGKPSILREVAGAPHGILPSVVAHDGELKVGEIASKLLIPKSDRSVAEVKRKMGSDEKVAMGSREYSPQEISAMILRHLKSEAERLLGEPVTEAVITVPAYFDVLARRATIDAADLAGLSVRRLINEPTAAALAYGIERPGVEEKIVVYDLGGGTLDVTVLELSEGILDVLSTSGNHELGGKDFDERLMPHLERECLRATGVKLSDAASEALRLRREMMLKGAAKSAKEELSSLQESTIILSNIGLDEDGMPVDFEHTLTRAAFDDLIRPLVESTRTQLDDALQEAKLTPAEIDTVLMIGGSTRVPLVREFVSSYFGGRELRTEVSPDEAVALGAAILSGMESRVVDPDQILITDVSPFTLGVSVLGEQEGAWVRGVFDPLIRRNQTIPRTATKKYSTAHDGQRMVLIEVFQGEEPAVEDNLRVGEVMLPLDTPGPAGQPIEVEFSYNLNGDLEVAARDLQSGREMRSTLQPMPERLSEAERETARDRLQELWGKTKSSPELGSGSPREAAMWRQSPLFPSVEALLNHAEKQHEILDPPEAARLNHLMNEMKAALERNDESAVRRVEQTMTDLLFELS